MRNSIVCSVRKSSGHGHRHNERVPFRKGKRPAFFCFFFFKVETIQRTRGQRSRDSDRTRLSVKLFVFFFSVISCCSINSINEPVVEFLQQSAGTEPAFVSLFHHAPRAVYRRTRHVRQWTCFIDSTSHTAFHCADPLLSTLCRLTI